MMLALAALLGYLLGAFPTGYLVGWFVGRMDVRDHGSGSTGATNVARKLGFGWAAVVMAVDVGKGALAVVLARELGMGVPGEALSGLTAVVGHSWPVYLQFRGGRGVATGIGTLMVVAPAVGAGGLAGWILAVALTRYVSLGSVLGVGVVFVVGVVSLVTGARPWETTAYLVIGSALIIARHRENIVRVLAGTERKLGQPAPQGGAPASPSPSPKLRPQVGPDTEAR
ncbi:MAG: glycerol-3-phosphate 1-O-acyltransferase PlsY [Chloroflexota bacterium]